MYEHSYTVPYDFDTNNVNDSDIRNAIRQYYALIRWCKDHAKAPYTVDPQYHPDGITVYFESEKDNLNFLDYMATEYWIFLHN